MVAGLLENNSDAPPDPIITLPCFQGPMDISQLRFNPNSHHIKESMEDPKGEM